MSGQGRPSLLCHYMTYRHQSLPSGVSMTKVCALCKCTKSLDSFCKQPSTPDGLRPWCKQCVSEYNREWRIKNKEKKAINDRQWKNDNQDRVKRTLKEYYEKNKEKITESNRIWSLNHPEKVKKAKKEWGDRNIEYTRQKGREYWKKNPEKTKIMVQNRRARRLASGTRLSYGITTKVLEEQGYKCPGCLCDLHTNKRHIDHFMPLILGGLHTDNNIQMLCVSCNLKKSKKHPLTWLNEILKTADFV